MNLERILKNPVYYFLSLFLPIWWLRPEPKDYDLDAPFLWFLRIIFGESFMLLS